MLNINALQTLSYDESFLAPLDELRIPRSSWQHHV